MSVLLSRRAILQAAALLPGLALLPWSAIAGVPLQGFTHSVASGDPQQDSVVLWTRFVPAQGGEATLRVEIAEDEKFARIVSRGTAVASPLTDYCAHARPTRLKPGRFYYYRFVSTTGEQSPTGRTRTLPKGPLAQCRIGIFSCANATSGWFTAYAHAAARDDLDLIVHVGDYIYESPTDRSDALATLAAAREIMPKGEAVSLADYRLRYASYRADPGLQELHRRFPIIAMWDDHEVADNSWQGGAKKHKPENGSWEVRKTAGIRAFREWLPMGSTDYDQYQIGDLATIFRLETRLLARSRQLDLTPIVMSGAPLPQAAAAFRDGPLADPARTMMGPTQEKWLADGLSASVAAGTPWQILAQQVILAPGRMPAVGPAWYAPGVAPDAREQQELALIEALGKLGVTNGLDRWDGYPAARARLLDSVAQARADLVVLTGDSHNAWAYDLEHAGKPSGVEFAGHAVSSLGIEKRFGGNPAAIAADILAANPNLKWCDTARRGYMVANITPRSITNEWLFLGSRDTQSTALLDSKTLAVERGARRLVAA
jgi:alkaline phosphatase D